MNLALHTESEIKTIYKYAANPTKQIGILADLNGCGRNDIKQILGLLKDTPTPKVAQPKIVKVRKVKVFLGTSVDDKITQMYNDGLTDKQICKLLNCSSPYVGKRRKALGLYTKYPRGIRVQKSEEIAKHNERMRLYNLGMTDEQMANQLGCHKTIICTWRYKNKLPFNAYKTKADENYEIRKGMYDKGMTDDEMGEALGCSMFAIYQWRYRNKLKRNKKGDNIMELKDYRTKEGLTQLDMAIKIGVSLMTYQLWERKAMNPSEENQKKIDELLKKGGR